MPSGVNFVWLVLCVCGVCAQNEVSVVLLELQYGQQYTLTVNRSVEYLVEFVATEEQRLWPSRMWASASAGDIARPVLLTARQSSGAASWQLPYLHEERLLYELQRTLCPGDAGPAPAAAAAGCDAAGGGGRRGGFSLHVGSTCAAPVQVSLRADAAPDFVLAFETATTYYLTQAAPRVAHYRWAAGQDSARLVASSEDDACATVSVQNYTCPIAQSMDAIETRGLRMTMERSGAVQLSRAAYPRGFLVVAVARGSGAACGGAAAREPDWLWQAAVWGEPRRRGAAPAAKLITFTVKAALSRAQYAVAAAATLALFLVFYLAFGALLLARRWPPLARRVGSLAVLADHEVTEGNQQAQSQADGAGAAAEPRRRRGSNATFDSSSDDSDTDSEPEPLSRVASPAGPASPATATTAAPSPASPSPAGSPASPSPAGSPASPSPAGSPASPSPAGSPASPSPAGSPAPPSPAATPPPGFRDADAAAATESAAAGPAAQNASSPNESDGTTGANGHVTTETDVQQRAGGGGGAGGARPVSEPERPFGLPRTLRLDALARRRGRVLRARSDRYLHTLYTVAVFYALPVIQFVAAFQIVMNMSGSLDICYYNFLCAHPAGALADFNHVLSNLGYLLLGGLLMLQLRARRRRRKRAPRHEEYGIPAHHGLLGALGAGMMVVALLSASYHVCPNRLNFQFDVAFMYVLAVLSMVKIYQARHPDVNARAHATFAVLALLIALVVWGVLGGGALFWGAATVLHVFAALLLSLRIYYVGQFRLEKASLAVAARGLRALPAGAARARPLYVARLVLLLIANAVNWAFALYGLFTQAADFASHLLNVLLANTLMYMLFYLTMKLLHGERPRWYAWCYLGGAVLAWAPALYFFMSGSSDWSATPAQSRHRNHECKVLEFYDSHDLWHLLSAAALYLSFAAMMTWDDGLSAVRRADIAVF